MEQRTILSNWKTGSGSLSLNDLVSRLSRNENGSNAYSEYRSENRLVDTQTGDNWIKELGPLIPAAVLVPIISRDSGLQIILTKRAENLKKHPGQISFPGGRVDPKDQTIEQTALRETEEEIGLKTSQVQIVYKMKDYVVGTGYNVTPFIGLVKPPIKLIRQKNEVAEIFELPVDYITSKHNFSCYGHEYKGKIRYHDALSWKKYFIWGATAGILKKLSERLLTS